MVECDLEDYKFEVKKEEDYFTMDLPKDLVERLVELGFEKEIIHGDVERVVYKGGDRAMRNLVSTYCRQVSHEPTDF